VTFLPVRCFCRYGIQPGRRETLRQLLIKGQSSRLARCCAVASASAPWNQSERETLDACQGNMAVGGTSTRSPSRLRGLEAAVRNSSESMSLPCRTCRKLNSSSTVVDPLIGRRAHLRPARTTRYPARGAIVTPTTSPGESSPPFL
jgi:hypothetical protein